MIHSTLPAKILIGISLDANESRELLSWAIKILAHPGDTIVALHVMNAGSMSNNMKRHSARNHQRQFRLAKSFVISIMGELVKTCQSNEVNLEARVGLYSSAGKGVIEEAKTMGADYVVIGRRSSSKLGGENNRSADRNSSFITSLWKKMMSRHKLMTLLSTRPPNISTYCSHNVPRRCSLILVRTNVQDLPQEFDGESNSSRSWSEKNSFSSDENETKKPSPRSVLGYEESSNSNSGGTMISSTTNTSCLDLNVKTETNKKPKSGFKSISDLFRISHNLGILRKKNHHDDALFEKQKPQQPLLRCFSYQEIATATNNFHTENMVGQGGYSEVYKGVLGNGSSIAVKRLAKDSNNSSNNKEKDFLIELGVIGHVNHPNTAKLTGYCIDHGLYLIFNYYPNGTLSSALHDGESERSNYKSSSCLDWATRYRIILGIAKGLHYLHTCCKHRIIHRDIKASNVLLGPDYNPQISDFGLAKWLPTKWSHHAVLPIEGTFGYLAPEYFMHGIVDEKTDIFAFGILILEIITGRRPVDSTRQNLLLWARPLMESGKLSELADPKMKGRYEMNQLFRVALTASYCVRQSSIHRPAMTQVIELLLTHGNDSSEVSWRIPKFTSGDEILDDYSMIFGYNLPSDLSLEDI